jgi:hypothetical protein
VGTANASVTVPRTVTLVWASLKAVMPKVRRAREAEEKRIGISFIRLGWGSGSYATRVQRAGSQCSFLHHDEEDGHQNEYVKRRSDHASYDRSGNRLHDIGADTGLQKDPKTASLIDIASKPKLDLFKR